MPDIESTHSYPTRCAIVGTPISITSFSEVLDILGSPRQDSATVIAVCNVHSVMSARRDPDLARALADADVATPDGMPIVWALRWMGHEQDERLYGPDLMRLALERLDERFSHFFLGSTPETLKELQTAVRKLNPNVRIAGAVSPPFRRLESAEENEILDAIRGSQADIVWVGLGMPKQEHWMHRAKHQLPGVTLVGVGAAFDFLAGTKREAPTWMKERGLEWLFRLSQEPRRLWRRYLWNNPGFATLLTLQLIRHRMGQVVSNKR